MPSSLGVWLRSGWTIVALVAAVTVAGFVGVAGHLLTMKRADYANQVSSFARYVEGQLVLNDDLDARALTDLLKVYLLSTEFECSRVTAANGMGVEWPTQCFADTAARDDQFRYGLTLSGGSTIDVFISKSTVYAYVARTNLTGLIGLGCIVLAVGLAYQRRQRRLLKKAYLRQEAAKVRLDAVLANLSECVVTLEPTGRILTANHAAEKTFGGSPVGWMLQSLIDAEGLEAFDGVFGTLGLTYASDAFGKTVDVAAMRLCGATYPAELTVDVAETPDGKVLVAVIRDVSEQKQRESVLYQAVEAAEQASAVKSEFVATVSHELRTPLNGILGLLGLVDTARLSADDRRHVDGAVGSGRSLLRIVNDILDFSKVESGRMDVEPATFEIAEMMDEILGFMRPQAEAKGLSVEYELDPDVPTFVVGDRLRVGQVLCNLIGNAVKFTEQGLVGVSVECLGETDGRAKMRFCVYDSGCGIALEDQERIFEDFTCLVPSYSRNTTGTGLGLPIARKIVSLMQGEMGVRSDAGRGSDFWFDLTFPVPEVAPDLENILSLGNERGEEEVRPEKTILVVDPSPTSRVITSEILTSNGFRVLLAAAADEALASVSSDGVDLVVLDTAVRDAGGAPLARHIRTALGDEKPIPVLGLTAVRDAEKRNRLLDEGYDRLIVKPYECGALGDTVAQLLEVGAAASTDRAAVS